MSSPADTAGDWPSHAVLVEPVGSWHHSDVLVERDTELAALRAGAAATVRAGRVVLVSGEAGIGKTALVEAFLRDLPARSPVLQGGCQSLSTPPPLAPMLEIAALAGGAFTAMVRAGADAPALARALLELLGARPRHVLVLEDMHWADDATLDVVRFVCRRIEDVRALVVLTYRDDELGAVHPLRVLLGDLARTRSTSRLALAPLSPAAVGPVTAWPISATCTGGPMAIRSS